MGMKFKMPILSKQATVDAQASTASLQVYFTIVIKFLNVLLSYPL